MNIPYNKPYLTGKEVNYIYDAVNSGKLSGNGKYTKLCQDFFCKKYGFKKSLLTNSCTDALEMASILLNLQPGDEVIVPSYTFVSTANAFVLRGAKIVFTDSYENHPNIDVSKLEALITEKTKAIVVVHYSGVACDMDKIMELANKYNIYVIEDAAQAIDSYYKDNALGSIGHLGTFSFHETKNIISGEGGMLVINDDNFIERAEIIWEKGTNRAAFFRGEVDKYGWVDIGSSYLPSELTAAFLYAQLECINDIQKKRLEIWNTYYKELKEIEKYSIKLPETPEYATNNGHIFYIICSSEKQRSELIKYLKEFNILSVFHYVSLHKSKYYYKNNPELELVNSDMFSDRLLRLPLYYELLLEEQMFIISKIKSYFNV